MTASVSSPIAFINMPYAPRHERVYLAFIAGIAGFGMIPTAAVKDPSSQFQLDRIFSLVTASDYSFHDLSHMSLDRSKPVRVHDRCLVNALDREDRKPTLRELKRFSTRS